METQQNTNPDVHEETSVGSVIYKYISYWPLFLIFTILCLAGAYLYLWYATPLYQAMASLVVKDQKKGSDDSKLMEQLDAINTNKIIDNEVEVIKSRILMAKVVKALHLYAPVFQEGKFKSTSAYQTSPVLIQAAAPDNLTQIDKVYLQYDSANAAVLLDNKYRYQLNKWSTTPYGTLRFVHNPKYYNNYINKPFYFSLIQPRNAALGLLGNLEVYPSSKASSVIDLNYTDEVPVRAEDILNELLINYTQAAMEEKSNLAKNTLSFVEGRLAIVSHELDSIERQIQQYKSGTGAVNLSSQGEMFLQNVSSNDQKLSDVDNQLVVLGEVEKFVTNKDNNAGIVPSTVGVNDPVLTQLVNNLYSSQLEYEKLKKTVAENNPLLVSVADQINKIKPDILNNIQSRKRSLEASKGSYHATNNSYNSVLQTIPAKEKQLLEISRAQAIKSNIYSFLLQKREESSLSYAGAEPDSKIVDFAQVLNTPVSPPKAIYIYGASIFLALLVTIGLVNAKELLNTKVLYRHELERLSTFPIIGEIAYKKTNNPIVIEEGKRTFIAEEFRKVRLALAFLGIGEKSKKILVTSSIPGEGKSFIAANLAVSLALTGKKVVLVDLDLNNPSLSKMLSVDEEFGISNYLTGEKEPEEIIKRLAVHENLFFVPPGSLPAGPSELLMNGKVKEIISYLENIFDFVIIDTAPVLVVTDTYLLSDYCDATLYVVRHNYTPKMFIKRIAENNKINPLTNPAIIFNGVKARGLSKNHYGYGYDYIYEYKQKPIKGKKAKKSVA
ncbi:MAG: polysaccharide biosynthesis tyrosine autokinase [Ginsengibacter sp.]